MSANAAPPPGKLACSIGESGFAKNFFMFASSVLRAGSIPIALPSIALTPLPAVPTVTLLHGYSGFYRCFCD